MNIGQLNERIKLLRINEGTSDGRGGREGSGWVEIQDTWAKVEHMHGSQSNQSGQTVHEKNYLITMRSRRPNEQRDYDPNDTYPGDFYTSVSLNEISERFACYYRGRLIVFHSVIEEDKWKCVIEGVSKKVGWQPASS